MRFFGKILISYIGQDQIIKLFYHKIAGNFINNKKKSPTGMHCICWYCTKRLESGGEQRKRYTTNLCQENDADPLLLVNTRHIPHKQIWPLTFLIRSLASMPTISSCHPHLNERKEVISTASPSDGLHMPSVSVIEVTFFMSLSFTASV